MLSGVIRERTLNKTEEKRERMRRKAVSEEEILSHQKRDRKRKTEREKERKKERMRGTVSNDKQKHKLAG